MAETQKASIGWGGEVWLNDGTDLVELVQVKSFTLPNEEVEEIETTHLKSPNRRREFISGMIDAGSVDVTLNYRPESDTDVLIRDAKTAGDVREVKFVVPETGVAAVEITTTAYISGYDRGEVTPDGVMEATVTFRITGPETQAAAVVTP